MSDAIGFRLVQPQDVRGPDGRFAVERRSGRAARILEGPSMHHLDVCNTATPALAPDTRARLRELCRIPRLATFGCAAIVNGAVAAMPRSQTFVNVHSYDNQLGGLRAAEPFLADGALVLVDDTNWDEPRQATLDFVAASGGDFEVVLDLRTTAEDHPTLRNGVMALRKRGTAGPEPAWPAAGPAEESEPAAAGPAAAEPLVTAIVVEGDDPAADPGTESLTAQTYPNLEVSVGATPREALEASEGEFVCLVHAADPLPPEAIEEALGP